MVPMAKNIIHISEAEAANNFAGVLARVRAGAEIVIEGREPIVVVRAEPFATLSSSFVERENRRGAFGGSPPRALRYLLVTALRPPLRRSFRCQRFRPCP